MGDILTLAFEFAADGARDASWSPPSEFTILRYGKTRTQQGDYELDEKSADEVVSAFSDNGNRLVFDYEHQSLIKGKRAPAAASFVIKKGPEGIVATDVKWTPRATKYLRDREYTMYSPAIRLKDGKAVRLINVALTNLPATKNLQPLITAKQQLGEIKMNSLAKALSLKEEASEAELLSAVMKREGDTRRLLSAIGEESVEEALGAVLALKSSIEQVKALKSELELVKADSAKKELDALIDAAILDGRVPPAKREEEMQLCQEIGVKAFGKYLERLPKASSPAVQMPNDKPLTLSEAGTLDKGQLKILNSIGISPEDYFKHKAKISQYVNPTEEK